MSASSNKTQKPTVLLVENDEDDAFLMTRQLQRMGYKVLWAKNLTEAELLFQEFGNILEAIFLDGNLGQNLLPGLPDTYPLIKAIKAAGYRGVLVSTTGMENFKKIMVEEGCIHADKNDLTLAIFLTATVTMNLIDEQQRERDERVLCA